MFRLPVYGVHTEEPEPYSVQEVLYRKLAWEHRSLKCQWWWEIGNCNYTVYLSDHFPPLLCWQTSQSTFIRSCLQTIKLFCQSSKGLVFTELPRFVLWIRLKRFSEEGGHIVFAVFCLTETLRFELISSYPVFSEILTFMNKLWFPWNF